MALAVSSILSRCLRPYATRFLVIAAGQVTFEFRRDRFHSRLQAHDVVRRCAQFASSRDSVLVRLPATFQFKSYALLLLLLITRFSKTLCFTKRLHNTGSGTGPFAYTQMVGNLSTLAQSLTLFSCGSRRVMGFLTLKPGWTCLIFCVRLPLKRQACTSCEACLRSHLSENKSFT